VEADYGSAGIPVAAAEQLAAPTDHHRLRAAFAAFATGVTVITVGGDTPHGMTANAFTSVSLDPPLVLVCVDRDARMHQALALAGGFAVSVLASDQEEVARHFASGHRPRGLRQFTAVRWSPGSRTGAPLIDGALAWFECRLQHSYGGGDHSIFVGRLVSVARYDRGAPLVFFDRVFRRLAKEGLE
jgi:flavin reductase (DIM6/NTAB) family NADH-FMN oxidoreductase RutF